jgi:hypothetical protein
VPAVLAIPLAGAVCYSAVHEVVLDVCVLLKKTPHKDVVYHLLPLSDMKRRRWTSLYVRYTPYKYILHYFLVYLQHFPSILRLKVPYSKRYVRMYNTVYTLYTYIIIQISHIQSWPTVQIAVGRCSRYTSQGNSHNLSMQLF